MYHLLISTVLSGTAPAIANPTQAETIWLRCGNKHIKLDTQKQLFSILEDNKVYQGNAKFSKEKIDFEYRLSNQYMEERRRHPLRENYAKASINRQTLEYTSIVMQGIINWGGGIDGWIKLDDEKQGVLSIQPNVTPCKQNVTPLEQKVFVCNSCNKNYASRNSLWFHRKKCVTKVAETVSPNELGLAKAVSSIDKTGFPSMTDLNNVSNAKFMPIDSGAPVTDRLAALPMNGGRGPSQFDWRQRAKEIEDQVKKRGLNPNDFGITLIKTASPEFSWKGYAKMICTRLQATMDPALPVTCGCPPMDWNGWRN